MSAAPFTWLSLPLKSMALMPRRNPSSGVFQIAWPEKKLLVAMSRPGMVRLGKLHWQHLEIPQVGEVTEVEGVGGEADRPGASVVVEAAGGPQAQVAVEVDPLVTDQDVAFGVVVDALRQEDHRPGLVDVAAVVVKPVGHLDLAHPHAEEVGEAVVGEAPVEQHLVVAAVTVIAREELDPTLSLGVICLETVKATSLSSKVTFLELGRKLLWVVRSAPGDRLEGEPVEESVGTQGTAECHEYSQPNQSLMLHAFLLK